MNKILLFISLTIGLSLVVSSGHSQTDSTKKGSPAELEKAHRQELNQWILRAYEGDRDAQFKVGVLFTNDQFDEPDYQQAVYWYKQAALQGHVLAQYNLGHQYLAGLGIDRSERQAMEWWLKAAQSGHALAQFNVGRGYYLGIGLAENHKKSRQWFERAAKNGEQKSIEILSQITWREDTAPDDTEPSSEAVAQSNDATSSETPVPVTPAPQSSLANATPAPAAQLESKLEPAQETTNAIAPQPKPSITPKATAKVTPKVAPKAATKPSTKPQQVASVNTSVKANATSKSAAATNKAGQRLIKVFPNPEIDGDLIPTADITDGIKISKRSGEWTSINSTKGFPVWVHGDFVKVKNKRGTITGSNVNARSKPNVANGAIVGRLNKGETLQIISDNGTWYRLNSPARFVAWVKTQDLDSLAKPKQASNNSTENTANPELVNASDNGIWSNTDNNEWLFNQSPDGYTLQLSNFSDDDKTTRLLEDGNIDADRDLRAFATSQDNSKATYYLYGSYLSEKEAKKAKKGLKLSKAWVRTFEELQQNRCVTWKTQLPTPQELTTYCLQ